MEYIPSWKDLNAAVGRQKNMVRLMKQISGHPHHGTKYISSPTAMTSTARVPRPAGLQAWAREINVSITREPTRVHVQ